MIHFPAADKETRFKSCDGRIIEWRGYMCEKMQGPIDNEARKLCASSNDKSTMAGSSLFADATLSRCEVDMETRQT
ncbi:hypothetical protein NPIL_546491 [Nephila pilipes]|uniref:Uncharacterized protein n=1 Tax=Nephila pilipes TaxID=299642 RepID=A0A8X6MAM0_NEPPI|nr:hypothetical protein NPIL_546491 [Nephila pilipes]